MAPLALRTWLAGRPAPGEEITGATAVVIDVLRATSTAVTALAHGAAAVAARAEVEEALALRAAYEEEYESPLLGGERDGLRIPGFDLGNSPREYTPEVVADRPVILCTTNGTAAVTRCREAAALYVASFLNAGATAAAVVKKGTPVALCCAGKEGAPSLEDICCAGLIATLLGAAQPYAEDDATALARLCWRNHKKDVPRLLRTCGHGRFLSGLGFDADLVHCARVDALPVAAARGPEGNLVRAA